ncbi:MAG: hypothetical protein KGI50_06780 [Patescibacteria group bacterium]|nr:hypothetical protein [Patescibacteria group bacterium]MDE2439235.1 hypothetical protein [Patescibacteria group bacterium]
MLKDITAEQIEAISSDIYDNQRDEIIELYGSFSKNEKFLGMVTQCMISSLSNPLSALCSLTTIALMIGYKFAQQEIEVERLKDRVKQ